MRHVSPAMARRLRARGVAVEDTAKAAPQKRTGSGGSGAAGTVVLEPQKPSPRGRQPRQLPVAPAMPPAAASAPSPGESIGNLTDDELEKLTKPE